MNSKRKGLHIAAYSLILLFALLLLSHMGRVGVNTEKGLGVILHKVIPSVFPYLVLSGLLYRTGLAQRLGRLFGRPFRKIFRLPMAAFPAVLLGVLCGFPVGAKCAVEMYMQGFCTKKEAERIAAFTNFCGPPFILGAVGVGIFSNIGLGWLIFLCQTAVSLLFGFFYRRPKKGEVKERGTLVAGKMPSCSFKDFSSAIADATVQMVKIAGFVLFFAVTVGLMTEPFGAFFAKHTLLEGFLIGIFEISSGISAIQEGTLGAFLSCTLIVGFSGVSVFMQVSSLMRDAGLSMKGYLLAHLICPPVSALLACLFAGLLGIF